VALAHGPAREARVLALAVNWWAVPFAAAIFCWVFVILARLR
jgi:ACR3 family arsenite efflux pump ArsB